MVKSGAVVCLLASLVFPAEAFAQEGYGSTLVATGDSFMPFIIGGIALLALIVLIVALVLMRRK